MSKLSERFGAVFASVLMGFATLSVALVGIIVVSLLIVALVSVWRLL